MPTVRRKINQAPTPKDDDALANTFQVHVQVSDDPTLVSCVKTIAEKHNLATKQIEGYLVVYKPYPKKIRNFSKS